MSQEHVLTNILNLKCDFFRLTNELDRNHFLLGNSNEWIIPEFQSFQFEYLFRYVQTCGSNTVRS
jgi:hypothetical protein